MAAFVIWKGLLLAGNDPHSASACLRRTCFIQAIGEAYQEEPAQIPLPYVFNKVLIAGPADTEVLIKQIVRL